MCLYISHVRVCCRCRHEVTVLISESLCSAARRNGVFASCGTGPGSQRSPKRYHCWGCRENVAEDVEAELAAEMADMNVGANYGGGVINGIAYDVHGIPYGVGVGVDATTGRPRNDSAGSASSAGSAGSAGSSGANNNRSAYHWRRRGSMK